MSISIIETIKSSSTKEILETTLRVANDNLAQIGHGEILYTIVVETNYGQILDRKRAMQSAFLAVVLADIGGQMSPYIRENNIKKIKTICDQLNLNYDFILSLSKKENLIIQHLVYK